MLHYLQAAYMPSLDFALQGARSTLGGQGSHDASKFYIWEITANLNTMTQIAADLCRRSTIYLPKNAGFLIYRSKVPPSSRSSVGPHGLHQHPHFGFPCNRRHPSHPGPRPQFSPKCTDQQPKIKCTVTPTKNQTPPLSSTERHSHGETKHVVPKAAWT